MRKPLITALLNPINLAILALAVAAGLCAAWWLFPVGLVFWAFMVFNVARDPHLQISHELETRTALAPRFQNSFNRVEKIQVDFFTAFSASEPAIQRALRPVQAEIDDLTDQAYRIGQRSSALENYRMLSEKNNNVENEWVHLSQQVKNATDPQVKKDLEASLSALDARIVQQRKIVAQLDRVDAQFSSLANTMEGVLADVLRLQSQGAEQVARNADTLAQKLHKQGEELRAYENEDMLVASPFEPLPPP